MRPFEFAGKTAFLTGAASGIGAALAARLASLGCGLALLDRDEPGLALIAETATSRGATRVSTHVADLSECHDHVGLVADVLAAHDRVDLVINNAGVVISGTFAEVDLADFEWLMDINFGAVVRLTKAFLPQLLDNPGSHVVNMSSMFGLIAPPGQAAYAASKFAVRGFSEALRHELAGQVGVTVVHPGFIKTNLIRNARISATQPSAADVQQAGEAFDTLARMSADEAAARIVDAVRGRKPRLVITPEAKFSDVLVRLRPANYWSTIGKLISRRKH
jgi:short-subunit dehydrogenase